jgi:asparagine N-glycosylation enzyme membrane subunit Stt3
VAACVALAVFAGASAAWAATARSAALRVARALACGALAAAALVAIPGVLQGRARAAEFLGKTDVWGTANPEQQSLFLFSGGTSWAEVLFGYLGYLVPVLPVYLAWRARRDARSAPLVLLACWTASFGALAILQTRFANDLAPVASVGFALLLGDAGAWLARRLRLPGRAGAVAVGLGAVLLALPLAREYGPRLRDTLAHLGGAGAGSDRALRSPGGTLLRFAQTVRAATPETSGFLDADARPEYGILSDPSLGHVLHYAARRATPSDNFGAYFPQGLMATLRVLLALPEEPALATLRELQVRYVVTGWQPAYRPDSLLYRLHELDGLEAGGHRALSRFRLVAEGPAGGVPLGAILAGADASRLLPYKLFEVVEGALLEIELEPGARAVASAEVITASGRRFRYSARGVADASGTARIRVPYASEGPPGSARTRTAWRIEAGGQRRCVEVSEQAVRSGAVVRVAPSAGCP